MNHQKYTAFIEIVERGSLTKAAQTLGYTQSGITHMIQSLEDEIGIRLLHRGRSGAKITTEGELLLPYFKDICNSERRLENQIQDLLQMETGLIRIGAFTSVSSQWLPYIIKDFLEDYPKVEFEVLHGEYAEIEKWIVDGSIDCGFLRIPSKAKLQTKFLREDEFVVILPLNHPLKDARVIRPQDLEKYPFALLDEDEDYEVSSILDGLKIHPKIRFTVKDDHTIIAMVANGLCISIMPKLVLQNTSYAILQKSFTKPIYRRLGIAVKNEKSLSKAAKRFVEYTETWVENAI